MHIQSFESCFAAIIDVLRERIMRAFNRTLRVAAVLAVFLLLAAQGGAPPRSIRIETLPWTEAEKLLDTATVVMIPLGAQAKEHGPHLPLNNDWLLAEYFTKRVMAATSVVVYPTINYNFYPAFVEYPGSATLRFETARDLIVDVCRSLGRHGPRRFYVLNTGVSTLRPLRAAAEELRAGDSPILLTFTDILQITKAEEQRVARQEGGTHADELETSMMLYIDPSVVNMSVAQRDYSPSPTQPIQLTRNPTGGRGTYSPTGAWGDPSLATRDKGRVVVETTVSAIRSEIEELRRAALPRGETTAPRLTAASLMCGASSPMS